RPRRNDRQVARHHSCPAQLLARRCHGAHSTSTEVSSVDCRHRASDVLVMQIRQIREPHAVMQRMYAAVACTVPSVARPAEAPSIPPPPRVVEITRAEWQPAEPPPAAEAYAESKAAAPAPERDIRGSPERALIAVDRSRPPSPRAAIPEPAAIVI